MPPLNDLKQAMVKAAKDAEAIFNDDKLTSVEKNEHLEKVDAECKSLSDQIMTEESLIEKRKRFAGLEAENTPNVDEKSLGGFNEQRTATTEQKSPGQLFVESAGFKQLQHALKVGGSGTEVASGPVEMDLKTTLTEGPGATGTSGTSASGGKLVQADYRPEVLPLLFQPTTIAALMGSNPVTGNTFRYPKEITATNAASSVAEAASHPEAALAFSTVDEPIRKIGVFLKVTDEMLEDVAFIRGWVDQRLMLFLTIEEELQLLSGNGVDPDLTGLLNRSGLTAAQALSSDTRPDCIFKEITKIRIASFLEPDALVVHPTDWQSMRLAKDGASQYYGGGPFTGQYGTGGLQPLGSTTGVGEALWGKRVVSTQNISQGTALVGAFSQAAQILRGRGMILEATNSHDTDFRFGLVSIRASQREGLAVYRPSAFGTCTGL